MLGVVERVERLENQIYVAYKVWFEEFGSVCVPEVGELAVWWAELDELLSGGV